MTFEAYCPICPKCHKPAEILDREYDDHNTMCLCPDDLFFDIDES